MLPEAVRTRCRACRAVQGNIVTNFHVLGSVLKGLGPRAANRQQAPVKVAMVTLLGDLTSVCSTVFCFPHAVCTNPSSCSGQNVMPVTAASSYVSEQQHAGSARSFRPQSTGRAAHLARAGSDGVQQTYDGYLVGADRAKDLAVLRINAPKV